MINTHKELFKFLRLAPGIKVTPAIFQQVMDTTLIGLDFAVVYLDDILISNKTWKHARHVKELTMNKSIENCEFFIPKIKYLGQCIDEKVRKTDSTHTNEIKNMLAPTNVSSLQSFFRVT